MKVLITDRVGTIPEHVKSYAEEKALHLKHFFDGTTKVEVIFKADGQKAVAEMIVSATKGARLFATASSKDFQSVIDLLTDKIERQLRKFKGKMRDRKRSTSGVLLIPSPPPVEEEEEEVTYEDIIRETDY